MMKAKVTKRFRGVEDGKIYPRWIEEGETIRGRLAQIAVKAGWAKRSGFSREGDDNKGSNE